MGGPRGGGAALVDLWAREAAPAPVGQAGCRLALAGVLSGFRLDFLIGLAGFRLGFRLAFAWLSFTRVLLGFRLEFGLSSAGFRLGFCTFACFY